MTRSSGAVRAALLGVGMFVVTLAGCGDDDGGMPAGDSGLPVRDECFCCTGVVMTAPSGMCSTVCDVRPSCGDAAATSDAGATADGGGAFDSGADDSGAAGDAG